MQLRTNYEYVWSKYALRFVDAEMRIRSLNVTGIRTTEIYQQVSPHERKPVCNQCYTFFTFKNFFYAHTRFEHFLIVSCYLTICFPNQYSIYATCTFTCDNAVRRCHSARTQNEHNTWAPIRIQFVWARVTLNSSRINSLSCFKSNLWLQLA